ncbi:MAG TPA: hypothetical protein VGL92_13295 [Acidimicrobiia bacterium]|jgi:hypothetical protein
MPDVEDLYGLPLADFIPARDAMAKELRAAGRKEEAAEVKQARKPSLAAWALNQAARRHPEEVARLVEAGQALAEAQRAALEGDAGGLRPAGRALSEEVEQVGGRAAGFLDNASPVQRERIAATLRAAAADEAGADLLRRGVLVEDLEPAGFGLEVAAGAARPPPARPRAEAKTVEAAEVEAARRELRRAEAEAGAAETRAGRRAERAEAAARRAAEAHQEAEALRAEAEGAAAEAGAARRRAEAAAGRLAEAEAARG